MQEKLCQRSLRARRSGSNSLNSAGVLPTAKMPPKPRPPEERVDIREPRYALAALETIYRQCYQRPNSWPVSEVDIWHFGKFPEIWATNAIRNRPSGWTYKRAEPVVGRVRQLYIWAAPILEN